MSAPLLAGLFATVAFLYSMVGFGGGSSYLALLALSDLPQGKWRAIALLCNVVVVSGGTWLFVRRGHFSWRLFAPFVVTSVPAAYLCGTVELEPRPFLILLSICLLLAGLRMVFDRRLTGRAAASVAPRAAWGLGLPLGILFGGVSGLIGIGGGIFLAPILYMIGWGRPKEIAATASAFILVNSLAGLAGLAVENGGLGLDASLIYLPVAVAIAGQLGSRLGSGSAPTGLARGLTAVLVLFVGTKLLWGAL
ncbi:MAG TPA: sulfite exporter TauE/SafE family protein [Planctomycetota bacterium]|nr:sulfite exporter TauE/SafE family protein [Planctomycetota bacterium]